MLLASATNYVKSTKLMSTKPQLVRFCKAKFNITQGRLYIVTLNTSYISEAVESYQLLLKATIWDAWRKTTSDKTFIIR